MTEETDRLSTGIAGLDEVLGGGILTGSMVFLVGGPGAGKTLLAQSIGFHVVGTGETVLYFTALSEPHSKLLRHVAAFAFFDQSAIGERFQLLNLEQVLRQGAEETADAIVQMARGSRAGLVVLDGFRSVADFINSPIRVREFLYQLSAKLGVLGTTCIVTVEADAHDAALSDDMTMADVIVGMWYQPYRVSHARRIEVLKARGSNPLAGTHSLAIATEGITCYPQAEMLPVRPAPGVSAERATFGLPGLDAMLGGGLTVGSSTVIAGELGVGKTVLALLWLLEGARRGEPGLLLGFHEQRAQLIDKARLFNVDLSGPLERGLITIWTELPVALDPNRIAAGLRARIAERGVRRLVIDSERALLHALEPDRVDSYLAAIVGYLGGEQITTLFMKEVSAIVGGELDFSDTSTAVLAENVLLMRRYVQPAGLRSAIGVLKMRFSAFDLAPHEYTLTSAGIEVGAEAPDLPGFLTAGGTPPRTARPREAG